MKHPTTRQTREQRADAFFGLYAQAGSNRSLEGLFATCINLGLVVSLSTLRHYSLDYGWQDRVKALESARQELEDSPAGQVARMNDRQAQLGRAAQQLAAKAFEGIAKQTDAIGPAEAIRLAKDGQHIERLAMGEATSRQEIAVSVYTELVEAIVVLFEDALRLDDRDAMRRRFALGVDALVEAHTQALPLEARIVADASAEGADPAGDESS